MPIIDYENGGSEIRDRDPSKEKSRVCKARQLSWCFVLDVVSSLLQRHAASLLSLCKTNDTRRGNPDRRLDAGKTARGNGFAARHLLGRQKRSRRPFA